MFYPLMDVVAAPRKSVFILCLEEAIVTDDNKLLRPIFTVKDGLGFCYSRRLFLVPIP